MPIYTEFQNTIVLDSSAGDNIYTSYMEQILTQQPTIKSTTSDIAPLDPPKKYYGPSKATRKYLDYREKMQVKLMDLNDNMSVLLRESFESIDNICNRVRSYLNTNTISQQSQELLPLTKKSRTSTNDEQSTYEFECISGEEIAPKVEEEIIATEVDNSIPAREEIEELVQEEINEPSLHSLNQEKSLTLIKLERSKSEDVMSVIEEIIEETSKAITEPDVIKTDEEDLEDPEKMHWLDRQKEFMNVFKTSMKNIEVFVADMNKYVEDVNNRIDALRELPMWGNNQKQQIKNPTKLTKKESRNVKSFEKLDHPYTSMKQITAISDHLLSKINNLANENNVSIQIKSQVIPDVKSAKAVSNLHQRLVMQVEAKDSYACFRKLMKKSIKRMNSDTQQVAKKQTQQPNKPESPGLLGSILKKGSDLTKMFDDSLWFSHKSFKQKNKKHPAIQQKNNSLKKQMKTKKQKTPTKVEGKVQEGNVSADDDRTSSKSKNKSKQQLDKHNFQVDKNKSAVAVPNEILVPDTKSKIEWVHAKMLHTDQITRTKKYRDILDEVSLADVMPLKSEYPRKDDVNNDPKRTLLFQLTNDMEFSSMFKNLLLTKAENQKLGKLKQKAHKQTTGNDKTVVHYMKGPQTGLNRCNWTLNNDINIKKGEPHHTEKSEVVHKLKPYIFSNFKQRSVIVMPVTVTYNDPPKIDIKKLNNENQMQKVSKIKNVNAGFSQKKEKSNRTIKDSSMPLMNLVKKIYNHQKLATPISPPSVKTFKPISQQIQQCKSYKQLTNAERKMQNKEQQLICIESPLCDVTKIKNKKKERRIVKVSKLHTLTTSDEESNGDKKEKRVEVGGKRRKMLDHLHGLKQRNDKIKGKIQEVIDIIECKMVDILSCPESHTIDAFDAMEKEITNVLQMMKHNKQSEHIQGSRGRSDTSTDINSISEELYKKLQSIMDTPSSNSSIILENSKNNTENVDDILNSKSNESPLVKQSSVKNTPTSHQSKMKKTPSNTEVDSPTDLTSRIKDLSISSVNDSEQINKLRELSNSIRVAHEHIQEICDGELKSVPPQHRKTIITNIPKDGTPQKVVIFKKLKRNDVEKKVTFEDTTTESSEGFQEKEEDAMSKEADFESTKMNIEMCEKDNSSLDIITTDKSLEKFGETYNIVAEGDLENTQKEFSNADLNKLNEKDQTLESVELLNQEVEIKEVLPDPEITTNNDSNKSDEKLEMTQTVLGIPEDNDQNVDTTEVIQITYDEDVTVQSEASNNGKVEQVNNSDDQLEDFTARSEWETETNTENCDATWIDSITDLDLNSIDSLEFKDEASSSKSSSFWSEEEEKKGALVTCPIREMKFIENVMDIIQEVDEEPSSKQQFENVAQEQFSDNMNEIFQKLELVYKKLDDGDKQCNEMVIPESKQHIAPSEDLDKGDDQLEIRTDNIYRFLDTLTSIVQEGPIEIYTAREVYFTQVWHRPLTLQYATLHNIAQYCVPEKSNTTNDPASTKITNILLKKHNTVPVLQHTKKPLKYLESRSWTKRFSEVVEDLLNGEKGIYNNNKLEEVTYDQDCQTDKIHDMKNSKIQVNYICDGTDAESVVSTTYTNNVEKRVSFNETDSKLVITDSKLVITDTESSSYRKLIEQTIEYFKEAIQEPHLLTPLKNIEGFINEELSKGIIDPPKTFKQLATLRFKLRKHQLNKKTEELHIQFLKLFYVVFYIFIILGMNFQYSCS